MARLAENELGASSLDFRSDDPAEIRSWVKARVNVDIDLPAGSSRVRLLGARLIRFNGAPVAAVGRQQYKMPFHDLQVRIKFAQGSSDT